nr:MAG TPA: hypothetical protein [Caudoviricetes sp.]
MFPDSAEKLSRAFTPHSVSEKVSCTGPLW